jgi:hypothetical protein
VITDDVPAGSLGIARARQQNLEGYRERRNQRDSAGRGHPDDGKNPAERPGQR